LRRFADMEAGVGFRRYGHEQTWPNLTGRVSVSGLKHGIGFPLELPSLTKLAAIPPTAFARA
jgi:hypothetical protein